jgi:ribosomal protein L35
MHPIIFPVTKSNFSRCILLRGRALLRHHRSRRSPKQQRRLPPRRNLQPSNRQHRRHLRPPLHHLPLPHPLPHRDLPDCRPNMVGLSP